jgi:hypothetical protein
LCFLVLEEKLKHFFDDLHADEYMSDLKYDLREGIECAIADIGNGGAIGAAVEA